MQSTPIPSQLTCRLVYQVNLVVVSARQAILSHVFRDMMQSTPIPSQLTCRLVYTHTKSINMYILQVNKY